MAHKKASSCDSKPKSALDNLEECAKRTMALVKTGKVQTVGKEPSLSRCNHMLGFVTAVKACVGLF